MKRMIFPSTNEEEVQIIADKRENLCQENFLQARKTKKSLFSGMDERECIV